MKPVCNVWKNIGFVSTRLSGTDGVSLETEKWTKVFEKKCFNCFFMAGELDRPKESSFLVEEAHFTHPEIKKISRECFGSTPVSNSIIWANDDDLYGSFSKSYNCIEDDGDDDPCFVDYTLLNYNLDPCSLCIDAGDPNGTHTGELDINFETRVVDGDSDGNDVVDIGGDEYDP